MEGNIQTSMVTHAVFQNIQWPETLKVEQDKSLKDQMKKSCQSARSIGRKGPGETHLQTHAVPT